MTARLTARLTISFLLLALAFVVFLLLMAAPASAHHREDHTSAKVASTGTDLTGSGDSTDGSETSGTEEGSTAAGSESAGSTTESSTGSTSGSTSSGSITASVSTSTSSGSTSTTSSTDKHTEKSTTGIAKHGFDPDPVQTPSPLATKGPLTCPGYDDGDAGPYDHTNCDGTQGLHGNGGNGKCAGCTGKADDKWPTGQYVGDHNNGYECDHNGGIGKGNPAHSRCATIPPPPPPPPPGPCVDNPDTPMDECNPPPPVCVDNPNTPEHECLPPPPPPPPEEDDVEGLIIPNVEPPEERAAQAGPALPVTGATVGNFLWLALLLLGAGSLLLWRIRDRGERA